MSHIRITSTHQDYIDLNYSPDEEGPQRCVECDRLLSKVEEEMCEVCRWDSEEEEL